MLLTVDVGNTDTKLGYFEAARGGGVGQLSKTWRVATERRSADEFGVLVATLFSYASVPLASVEAVVISSVVPQVDTSLAEGIRRYVGIESKFFVPAQQRLIEIRTERPREVGADLVAAAIGAVGEYGTPTIVVNFGTATTFGAVSADGAYLGVAIAPGIQISIDALAERTAKLPQISLEAPETAIGRDTIASLQSGIVFGFVSQTEGMVARISAELGGRPFVVASGGLAEIVARHTSVIAAVDPHLVHLGLRRFYEASRP